MAHVHLFTTLHSSLLQRTSVQRRINLLTVLSSIQSTSSYTLPTKRRMRPSCLRMRREKSIHLTLLMQCLMKLLPKRRTITGTWNIIPHNTLPPGAKTILSIWLFKRKRSSGGELLKHKARLCAHGGMQTYGENYLETYSPTVTP